MRVAFDSMPRIRSTVLRVLAEKADWMHTADARSEARLPRTTAVRALEDLHAHGVVDREPGKAPKGDRWRLAEDYLSVWRRGHRDLPDEDAP
jgi:DNA-binding IclR family transcriptional regulator